MEKKDSAEHRGAAGGIGRIMAIAAIVALSACAAPTTREGLAATPEPTPAATVEAATPAPSTAGAAPVASPTVAKRVVTETQQIPFRRTTVNDPSLPKGTTRVRTRGVVGIKTLTYEVTFTNGVQTGRRLLREAVTRAPVTEVVAIGTKEQQRCDPNYSGACVPIASDVDCAGGSGNGPAYVQGPVRVIGTDIYDLDHDNDGIGCE